MPASRVSVDFSPAAQADLQDAIFWYEEHAGLGESLRLAVLAATNVIAMAPERWPIRRGKHRYVMRRFPYTIAYLTDGAEVKIIAVAHQKSDPVSWQNR